MRALDVTFQPDPAAAPPLFELIADSDHLDVAELHEWNPEDTETVTVFMVCVGARQPVVEGLRDSPLVRTATTAAFDGDRFGVLARVRREAHELVEAVFATVTSPGLIVLKPVIYRDGRVHGQLLGADETLQRTIDKLPPVVDVEVRAVRSVRSEPRGGAWQLSDRQRAALRVALRCGYYADPRDATTRDVAAALECAPSTASEHLRKAEARLVRAAMTGSAAAQRL